MIKAGMSPQWALKNDKEALHILLCARREDFKLSVLNSKTDTPLLLPEL